MTEAPTEVLEQDEGDLLPSRARQALASWEPGLKRTLVNDMLDRILLQKEQMGLLIRARFDKEYDRAAGSATDDHRAVVRQLTKFKEDVRDAAITVQANHASHLSLGELNNWLEELGLEASPSVFRVQGYVTVTFDDADDGYDTIRVRFDKEYDLADVDVDEPEEAARQDDELLGDYDFGIGCVEDVVVQDSEPVR